MPAGASSLQFLPRSQGIVSQSARDWLFAGLCDRYPESLPIRSKLGPQGEAELEVIYERSASLLEDQSPFLEQLLPSPAILF
jgi:hypothetical protein